MDFINDILGFQIGSIKIQTILVAVLLTLVGVLMVRLLTKLIKKVLEKSKFDNSLKSVLLVVSRVLLYVIVVLIVADFLGLPVTSLLTVLSIAGLAVSLAIQDTLANVFSGMLLLAAHTFSSGDYVQLDTLEGTVMKVDLMNTHLRTADNKTVRIPNKDVQASPIINYSREPIRRVEIRVSASYSDETSAVKASLLKAASRGGHILKDPAPFAGLFAFESSSIQYVVQAWTTSDSYWAAYYELTEGIRTAFEEDGISMTYDHIHVHMQ